jgi:hypothetical protein
VRRIVATLIVLSIPFVSRAGEPKYFLETKDAQKVVAKLPYGVTCPKMKATEWTVVIAQLPELPGQTKVKSTLVAVPPGGKAIVLKERGTLGRSMLALKIPAKTPELKTTINVLITYEATLHARVLTELEPGMKAPKVVALSAGDRKKALAATTKYDFETALFKKWLADEKLLREPKESDIDFARRTYETLRGTVKFFLAAKMDRKASDVALAKKSDDTGMSNLFVAVMRANKVPARGLFGRWTTPAIKGRYLQWQTVSEFYADGVGWVPVDVSNGARRESSAGFPEFGHDAGQFLTFHVDQDIPVDVPGSGVKTLETLQSPNWFVRGDGTGDGIQFREDWTIEKLP